MSTMIKKWFGNSPSESDIAIAENLITKFFQIKKRLVLTQPAVKRFLNRYNTPRSTEPFDPKRITDIGSYTIKQLKFLIGEFFDDDQNEIEDDGFPEVLKGNNLEPSKEIVEASKSLWYSVNKYTIVNEEGFRVYQIPDQKTSINFGYYEGDVTNRPPFTDQPKSHMKWCTTRHLVSSNLWSNYRDRRTFYFVIDESKNPSVEPNVQINQYYLSALQFATDSRTNFRITSILNDGSDPTFTEDEIYAIWPKLKGHLDKIIPVEYDAKKEAGENTDIVNLMNEREGNEYEFAAQSYRDMKSYIDRGKIISKAKSWDSMDDGLKQSYIDITDSRHVKERFSSPELLDAIRSKTSDLNSLVRRLGILGFDFNYLVTEVYLKNFDYQRASIKNQNIALLRDNTNNLFGLFDHSKADWLKSNGVTYNNKYSEPKPKIYTSPNDETYVVEEYHVNRSESNESFYGVTKYEGEFRKNTPCNFFSRQKWEKAKEELRIFEIDEYIGSFSDQEIPDESDIQEVK
jgi:hypothetical protein